MHHRPLPPLERLYALFRPNFMTGELVRRTSHGAAKRGTVAGRENSRGYLITSVDGHLYYVHRVLFALYHQTDPRDMEVDHIDGDKLDNRVANLRAATRAQNGQNIRGYRKGLKGAYRSFKGQDKEWMATIQKEGVRYYLGSFYTEKEAHEAYVKASVSYHGEFGRAH